MYLEGSWHRQDPRGNKPGVDAQFSLQQEQLGWPVDPAEGEVDYPTVSTAPVPEVVNALTSADDVLLLYRQGLPPALKE